MTVAAFVVAVAFASPPSSFGQVGAADDEGLPGVGIHVVKAGESMFSIASRYHLTVGDLSDMNGTQGDSIMWPGRELRVPLALAVNARAGAPAPSGGAGTTTAGTGSSLDGGATTDDGESSDPVMYSVAAGDTLYAISRRFGTSVDDLRLWNGLPADGSILAGETLVVRGWPPTSGGDPDLPSGTAATGAIRKYTVRPGDTLYAIAERLGTTANELRALNGLPGDDLLAGQVLVVSANAAPAGSTAGAGSRIEIDIGDQRMTVWQGSGRLWSFVVSTGMAGYPTRRGSFAVQSKIPNAWSSPWQLWMPWWLGIYWAGGSENGIHALPVINGRTLWAGYLGTPISYGCIVLSTADAVTLYNWARIGTPVEIHD